MLQAVHGILGATICSPKSPACGICPWRRIPVPHGRREPKANCRKRRQRSPNQCATAPFIRPSALIMRGYWKHGPRKACWAGRWRPARFAVGGHQRASCRDGTPPLDTDWQTLAGEVRHTFTHFHLILTVKHAMVPQDTAGDFVTPDQFRPSDLPTVMRKAFDLSQS